MLNFFTQAEIQNKRPLIHDQNIELLSKLISSTEDESIEMFVMASETGQIEVAKWLIHTTNNNVNVHYNDELPFRSMCGGNHLEMVKWFIDCYPETDFIRGFNIACLNGGLEVSKWLYEKYPNNDSYQCENRYNFRWTCAGGHLEVAKWLLNTFPDIDIHYNRNESITYMNVGPVNQSAFGLSCHYNQIEVVKWLSSMYEYYTYEVIDDKIVYGSYDTERETYDKNVETYFRRLGSRILKNHMVTHRNMMYYHPESYYTKLLIIQFELKMGKPVVIDDRLKDYFGISNIENVDDIMKIDLYK